ncbi:CheR family methyltransferase [Haliangium ochraceum]|uniref:MCP methyltransferase, CheR-type n=1 Tax=Haliangium ochraceum (strain DSM 14365 / JCM 11303 / SMP-2) TaxID=502025 RepID=D0LTR4_HALO1|nr:protein-glutamate O-methyltransferase CheR [Haliangium ochraceum]ACY15758.1 MCP methyltransferase, CheR-type [Haliangium ochraceum DSM 14365]
MSEPPPVPLESELRGAFATLLEQQFGLVFPSSRQPLIDDGVRAALRRLDESAPRALLERMERDDAEAWEAMATAMTIGETYFFRDPSHFDLLRLIMRGAPRNRRMRLWSSACANGAEPYSMAILALEEFGAAAAERVEILGTDIDRERLATAREGVYRPWSLRNMPPQVRERWFAETEAGGYALCQPARALVRFRWLNLIDSDDDEARWPHDVDVAFCRNVLVYFGSAAIARTAAGLRDALRLEGWLIPGPSDPLLACAGLSIDASPGFIAYRRRTPAPPPPSPQRTTRPPPLRLYARRRSTTLKLRTRARSQRTPERPSPTVAPPAPAHAPAAAPPAPTPPGSRSEALGRARALADAGKSAEALAELKLLLSEDPLQADAYLLRATLLQAMGQHDAVIADTKRALLLDRKLAFAHVVAATSFAAQDERAQARRALRNARVILASMPASDMVRGAQITAAELHAACRQLQRALLGERAPSPSAPGAKS